MILLKKKKEKFYMTQSYLKIPLNWNCLKCAQIWHWASRVSLFPHWHLGTRLETHWSRVPQGCSSQLPLRWQRQKETLHGKIKAKLRTPNRLPTGRHISTIQAIEMMKWVSRHLYSRRVKCVAFNNVELKLHFLCSVTLDAQCRILEHQVSLA